MGGDSKGGKQGIDDFSKSLWAWFFKEPIDTRPPLIWGGTSRCGVNTLSEIRKRFFAMNWGQAYDFLEFITQFYAKDPEKGELTLTSEPFQGNISHKHL